MIDNRTAAYGLLVLRVALGVLALSHGLTKLLVFTPAGTVGFFHRSATRRPPPGTRWRPRPWAGWR